MGHRTATERAIVDMRNVIVWHKKGMLVEGVKEEASLQAENLSAVVVQLQSISDEISIDEMETLMKNIFNNDIAINEIKRRKFMKHPKEFIIDPTELDIFTTGF